MKWMYLMLLVIAVFSGTAFSDAPDLWVATSLHGVYPLIQAVYTYEYPSGASMDTLYADTPASWVESANYYTAGLATGSPLGDFCVSYRSPTGNTLYIVTYKSNGNVVRTVTCGPSFNFSTGLAVQFTPSGIFPPGTYPYFVGASASGSGQIGRISTGGGISSLLTLPETTEKVTGLGFGNNFNVLYCLAQMDDSDTQYCVYRVTDFTYPSTATLWAGPFAIPAGALEAFDCGYTNGQVVFSVDHTCEYPLWSVSENGTTAYAIESISWADVGWASALPRVPRGVDFPDVYPWAPVPTTRETLTSTSIAPEISVTENPFRYSTIVSAETTGMLSIYDLSGRLVSESEFGGSYTFEPRASGVYFVQITDGETVTTARLVKL